MPNQNHNDYVEYGKRLKEEIVGGLTRKQQFLGLWYTTVPRWLEATSRLTLRTFLSHFLRLAVLFLIPATPYLSKRYFIGGQAPAPFTDNDRFWMLSLLLATFYGWWFDKVRRAESGSKLSAKKTAALLLDSAGTISALNSVLELRADQKTTSSDYRQHLQRILKRIHTEVGLLINSREETYGMVTLLLYGDNDGKELQVVARSSDASAPVKSLAAYKLMAHYVAQTGRDWIEHDFYRKSNLFPKVRLTKPGESAAYRSILFKPLLGDGATYCRGVLCIHSDRPYHFWKLGDDSKRDLLLLRLAPYFALLELLLEKWPYRVATDPAD